MSESVYKLPRDAARLARAGRERAAKALGERFKDDTPSPYQPQNSEVDPAVFKLAEVFCQFCHLYWRIATLKIDPTILRRRLFIDLVKTAAAFHALGRELATRVPDEGRTVALIQVAVTASQQEGLKREDWKKVAIPYCVACWRVSASNLAGSVTAKKTARLPNTVLRWLGSAASEGKTIITDAEMPNFNPIIADLRLNICCFSLLPKQIPPALHEYDRRVIAAQPKGTALTAS